MQYQVISYGRLLIGAKEKECIERIQRITKLSEEKVRNFILNGRQRMMFTSSDESRVKKIGQAYRNAGLDIRIHQEC